MTIYKIIDCYVGDEKVSYVLPYHVSFKQLKIFHGSMKFSSWLDYIFINSSLTETNANKKKTKEKIL